ncbi:MAG: hypothetical protein LM590_07165 [Thermofilum sp.]|nr:hypothetical protein [Thermofilum sp.]
MLLLVLPEGSNWERIERRDLASPRRLLGCGGSNWERIERLPMNAHVTGELLLRAATGKELKDTDRGDLHGIRELRAAFAHRRAPPRSLPSPTTCVYTSSSLT